MSTLLLPLFACDQPEPQPQPELEVHETIDLAPTDAGGYDDWNGAALGWAVDEAGDALVVAIDYPGGQSRIDAQPLADAAETAQGYTPSVPDFMADVVATYPVLDGLVTTPTGVRGMADDVTAILSRPDGSLWVAVDGEGRLFRGDGGDDLEGGFVFVEVTRLGFGAEVVDDTWGVEVPMFSWSLASGLEE